MKTRQPCLKRDTLFAYANHMLQDHERERVEAHLESCETCKSIVAGYRNLGAVLAEWKPVEPSPSFDLRIRRRIESSAPSRTRISWAITGWARWAAVAAIVALIVVAGVELPHALRSAPPAAHLIEAAKSPAGTTGPASVTPAAPPAAVAASTDIATAPVESAGQEMDLYKNLKVLENYDMLENFGVLSELPQASEKSND